MITHKPARSIFTVPPRVRTSHLADPARITGFRAHLPVAQRVSPATCSCEKNPNSCNWHKGRYGQGPREDDRHPIPRIGGISTGAFLHLCYIHRTQWWAIEETASRAHLTDAELRKRNQRRVVNCCPTRRESSRALGGRNSRTRPRDEHGVPMIGAHFEKGAADEGTITAYNHELRCARMPDGRPLLETKRWPNAPMDYYLHPEVLMDPDPYYTVTMRWDLGTPVPSPDPITVPVLAALGAASSESPVAETPLRLGSRTRKVRSEVGTSAAHILSSWAAHAAAEPWWPLWVEKAESLDYAQREIARVLAKLFKEGYTAEDFARVYALLSYQHERRHAAPDYYAGWFLAACRKGWHIPTVEASTAATLASEEREREAHRAELARQQALAAGAAREQEDAGLVVRVEPTDEEFAAWAADTKARLAGGRASPGASSATIS